MSRYFLIVILILTAATSVCGQRDSLKLRKAFWFDLGFGPGKKGLASNFDFNFELKKKWVFTFRVDGIDETVGSDSQSCPDKINSTGASPMIGRLIKKKNSLFLINIGPSLINLLHNPCSEILGEHHSEASLGFTISAKALVTSKHFGAGVNPFVNINDKRSYYGLTINLAVGRFR